MTVTLREMTPEEFERFYAWSAEQHAGELTEELSLPPEQARKEALAELAAMLPDGLRTEHSHLMTVAEKSGGECVGFLWTIREEYEGRRQSFLCDFAIWEPHRRRGYATAALRLAERQAFDAGCRESVLFAVDTNTPAIALYEKCGYHVLRQEGRGKYMVKPLP